MGVNQQSHTHHTPIYGRRWRRKDSQDLTLGLKLPFWRERWGAGKQLKAEETPEKGEDVQFQAEGWTHKMLGLSSSRRWSG